MPPLLPLPNSGTVSDSAPCARSVSLPLALGKWRRRRRRPRRRRRRRRRRQVHGARPPRSAGAEGEGTKLPAAILLVGCRPPLPLHGGSKTANWRQKVWPPAQGELGWGVTRRPLGAEAAPVRRLRAPDKSGAGESSAVSMEERETEEIGGRSSRKNTATISAASLPPCIGHDATPNSPGPWRTPLRLNLEQPPSSGMPAAASLLCCVPGGSDCSLFVVLCERGQSNHVPAVRMTCV
ncbi:uncharacterized protein [Vicugna pacos]|uniref:Uncharacterized protein isoform X2 n=1 Tax=Vicugna pacos TaxID=30538 RepID=A0ABM5DK72_VICPA